ncbi:helix-turn-helix domain-containing protein [Hydrocarboniphaga effusa]|uniref:helix-turn-helix domain-containing protein n=1 Tax=Hydrocarboniphaga effusa TaxID=243629 RepID=UPI003BAD2EEB
MRHNPVHEPQKLAYTVGETADLFGVSLATVWRLIRNGELESLKVGKSRRIARAAIEAYLARQEAAARDARKVAA